MVDVGSQRSERQEWIHCFESVTTVQVLFGIERVGSGAVGEFFGRPPMSFHFLPIVPILRNHHELTTDSKRRSISDIRFCTGSIISYLNKIDIFQSELPRVRLLPSPYHYLWFMPLASTPAQVSFKHYSPVYTGESDVWLGLYYHHSRSLSCTNYSCSCKSMYCNRYNYCNTASYSKYRSP